MSTTRSDDMRPWACSWLMPLNNNVELMTEETTLTFIVIDTGPKSRVEKNHDLKINYFLFKSDFF